MKKRFIADLHIHTCLSPCAELDMTPRRIIDRAVKKGLDIIAVTDHNSAENIEIAIKIARDSGIFVIPAMEVTSSEEAHLVALFDSLDNVMAFQEIVYKNLPPIEVSERLHGYQLIVNERDEIVEFNRRLLLGAVNLSLRSIVDKVHSFGGLAIASHIDREIFSVLSQFGFIPQDIKFDALEISHNTKKSRADIIFMEYQSVAWIASSDAHHLMDIGRNTTSLHLNEPSFEEIALAFKGERRIEW